MDVMKIKRVTIEYDDGHIEVLTDKTIVIRRVENNDIIETSWAETSDMSDEEIACAGISICDPTGIEEVNYIL